MNNQITIREAVRENDVAAFWEQLHIHRGRDVFPDSAADELESFLRSACRDRMMKACGRSRCRCFFLFFQQNGQDIGFTMPVIFAAEDGRCFITEYYVYPEFRGNGTYGKCAGALLDWAKENGALYAELNRSSDERRRFLETIGFIENGVDEWGEPLMLLPPAEDIPITVKVLADPDDRQLRKLENGFLKEIGEQPASEEKQAQLARAIRDGKITFFVAKRGCRAVGMCSVARCFSTFMCTDTGVFEDFYIEPAFRRKGIARMLAQTAQKWSNENALASLTVTCAPCDEEMYQALGFDAHLGKTFAYLR